MTHLEFDLEWVEAEEVRGPELAATWCYLVIRLESTVLSRVLDRRAKSVRDGIFLPAYPFAEWLVSNWWSLLFEIENPAKAGDAEFLWRHTTACARQGYALPNIEIVSSETRTRLTWESESLTRSQVEFIGPGGEAWIDKADFAEACSRFIDSVIRRLATMGIESSFLQQEWTAIQLADAEESEFCRTAGAIGWDPYSLDDRQRELVFKIDRTLTDEILEQAASIVDPENIDADLSAIESGLSAGRATRIPLEHFRRLAPSIVGDAKPNRLSMPWEAGYALARQARRHLGLNSQPLRTLEAIGHAIAEDPKRLEAATRPVDFGAAALVDGVMTMSDSEIPGFAFQTRYEVSRRFHFCRALAETLLHPGQDALITRATSDRQSLSRAFAAEFLAPKDALRELVTTPVVSDDDLTRLGAEFGVSSLVIQHQLQNHGIAKLPHSSRVFRG